MDSITVISSSFIVVGSVIMAMNIRTFRQVMVAFRAIAFTEYRKMKLLLRFHLFLIVSFLGGYVLVLYAILRPVHIVGDLFVGLIFMSGAVFVLLGIILQKKMIQVLGSLYSDSVKINIRLKENQETLSESNEKLKEEIRYRKEMEKKLIQSEKMVSVGGLAAGMAHEINNPLAGMIQNAQLVLSRLSMEMPVNINAAQEAGLSLEALKIYLEKRQIRQKLENINTAGERAAKIVENMLGFTRGSVAEKSLHDLGQIVDNSLEILAADYNLKNRYDLKRIDIKKTFDPDLPMVQCESNKIQQVVFNIVKNAAEAIHSQPHMDEKPCIHIRLYKERNSAVMEIEDNGPGMPPDIQKRVFEPFFTTKGIGQGTGLGLSVSYFIVVDDHGGEMMVSDGSARGAKFSINLPLS